MEAKFTKYDGNTTSIVINNQHHHMVVMIDGTRNEVEDFEIWDDLTNVLANKEKFAIGGKRLVDALAHRIVNMNAVNKARSWSAAH